MSSEKQKEIDMQSTSEIKRGRGRPKGSKNKPKTGIGVTVRKVENFDAPVTGEKKGRGRPKGSKNKSKDTDTNLVTWTCPNDGNSIQTLPSFFDVRCSCGRKMKRS